MSLFRRFIVWLRYWPEPKCAVHPGPPPDYQPPQLLNLGDGRYVLGPTPELLADADRWNEIVRATPTVRLTGIGSAQWH